MEEHRMFNRRNQIIERPVYVFECDLVCNNCGFEWTEEFEKGDEVVQEENIVMVGDGKKGISIHCLNCSSANCKITSRKSTENKK
jgi:hypothetical protein